MSAEKVIKIDNNYEVEVLMEKCEKTENENKMLKSILSASAANELVRLTDREKELECENIKLKAINAEKDKRLSDKDKQIAYMNKNIDLIADNKAKQKIRENDVIWNKKLKNAKSNGGKIVAGENKVLREEKEQLNNNINNLTDKIGALSAEVSDLNAKLDTTNENLDITNEMLCEEKELITALIDIINNSSSIDEIRKAAAIVVSEAESNRIMVNTGYIATLNEKKEFTKLIKKLHDEDGMTFKEISAKLYSDGHPMLSSCTNKKHMESKVSNYYKKEYN